MVEGRSSEVLSSWLENQTVEFRSGVKITAMDGFTGYKTAIRKSLPEALTVMDPFHVVKLAGDKLTKCRQRLTQQTLGRRGRKDDLLYKTRLSLLTRPRLLSDKSWNRVSEVITNTTYERV